MSFSKQDSINLHEEWLDRCKSCKFWDVEVVGVLENRFSERRGCGRCHNTASDFYQHETGPESYCRKWESFDPETAAEVIRDIESGKRAL